MDGETADLEAPPPRWSRQRLTALAVAGVFVAAVTGIAVFAAAGGHRLPKLPAVNSASSGAAGSTAAPALAPAYGVRYEIQGTLPVLGGTAPAYRLGSAFSPSAGDRLAAALGLHGKFVAGGDGWQLTDGNRTLTIFNGPGLPWSFGTDVAFATGGGVTVSGSVAVAGVSHAGSVAIALPTPTTVIARTTLVAPGAVPPVTACPRPPCPPNALCPQVCVPTTPPRPADLPTLAAAEQIARTTAAAAGFSAADADVAIDTGYVVLVDLAPRVGGLPTSGWSWSFDLGSKGTIQNAHGYLAQPARIGNYPLAGTVVGVTRLQEGMGVGPRPLMAAAGPTVAFPVCAPSANCPARTVTITGVHLALANGAGDLVPAYVFTDASGNAVGTVPATTDTYLAPSAIVPGVATTGAGAKGVPVPEPAQVAPAAQPVGPAPVNAGGAVGSTPCGSNPPPGQAAPFSCKG
jgi:hypothetical protein